MTDSFSTPDDVVVVEPAGSISARAVTEFEKSVHDRVAAGVRGMIIDFAQVELISGDGIRVLMMVAEELRAAGGSLVLCSLADPVRRVFEVSGLAGQFDIVGSRAEALARVTAAPRAVAAGPASSKLSRLVRRLLEGGSDDRPPASDGGQVPAELAGRVADLIRKD